VRVLGEDGDWRYIQGPDQYFGWVPVDHLDVLSGYCEAFVVAVLLASIRDAPRSNAMVIARLPTGTLIRPMFTSIQQPDGSSRRIAYEHPPAWRETRLGRGRSGYVAETDLVEIEQLPHRYPTADDYLKTAESFIGVPYLWGGTTALGLDCSGFVQQVYRLNGVALPRDADQQAMLGRKVEKARAGDLMFFGEESVTHVALATSATEFIHAPMKGGVVEPSDSLRPWLYRVAVNLSYNRRPRKGVVLSSLDEAADVAFENDEGSPSHVAEQAELRRLVLGAVDELGPKHRLVVVLHYMNGLNLTEIAEVVDCPVGTVK